MNVPKCWDAMHVFNHLAPVKCALRDCTDRMYVECKFTKYRTLCKLCLDLKSIQIRLMSDVNTQISLLHVDFSRNYLSLMGCMWSVKKLLLSVGLRQVCSPYSAQLSCYSFVSTRISWLWIWSFRANGVFSLYWA